MSVSRPPGRGAGDPHDPRRARRRREPDRHRRRLLAGRRRRRPQRAPDRQGAARPPRRRARRHQGRPHAPARRRWELDGQPRAPPRGLRGVAAGARAPTGSTSTSTTAPTRTSPTRSRSARSRSSRTRARCAGSGSPTPTRRADRGGAARSSTSSSVQNQLSLELHRRRSSKGEVALCERARDRVPALVAARRHRARPADAAGGHDPVTRRRRSAHGVSPQQVALAWLLALEPGRDPDPGREPARRRSPDSRAGASSSSSPRTSCDAIGEVASPPERNRNRHACVDRSRPGYDNASCPDRSGAARSPSGWSTCRSSSTPPSREKTVRFHQLNGETGQPDRAEARGPRDRRRGVLREDRQGLRAHEGPLRGHHARRARRARPGATRTIDIEDFVDLAEIDPVYYDHPYYLVPDKGAAKAYGLLLDAMRESGKVAIARVVLRSKEQLVAIRPAGRPC